MRLSLPFSVLFAFLFILTSPAFAETSGLSRRGFLQTACVPILLSAIPKLAKPPSGKGTVKWEVVGPDSRVPIRSGAAEFDLKLSAGELTLQLFKTHQIPFVGNESGIASILGTPTGDDAIEVVSDEVLRVYGWCYEVDGVQPSVMPDAFHFQKKHSVLRWFYGFSLYEKGVWKTYCSPAHIKTF